MTDYSNEELKRAAETLIEAEKIKEDPQLMKALKPYLEETEEKIDKIKDLDSLRKEAQKVINGQKDKEIEEQEGQELGEAKQKEEEKDED